MAALPGRKELGMSHYLNKNKAEKPPVADSVVGSVQDRLARVIDKDYVASPPRTLKPPEG